MKLNLGCGQLKFDGYENVNDVELTQTLPYADGSIERVVLFHVIEHLHPDDGLRLLKEILRILQPDGRLIIECPDIVKCFDLYRKEHFVLAKFLYGDCDLTNTDQRYYHRWGYTSTSLKEVVEKAGFIVTMEGNGITHGRPERDIRIEAKKESAPSSMSICLSGWYFHEPLLKSLEGSRYPAFMVCHRERKTDLPYVVLPNVGLEFNCYNWFLMNKWDGGNVLFLHDDMEASMEALDAITTTPFDQCFLFNNLKEAEYNGGAHGRAFFCSDKLLRKMYVDGGFWWDEGNTGQIPEFKDDEADYHNNGIKMFIAYLESLPEEHFTVNRQAVVPGLVTGYRGKLEL